MASTLDTGITFAANPDLIDIWGAQAENEAQLIARARAFLARTDITPYQRQRGEANLQQLLGSRVDVAEGNGKLFVDTAAEAGRDAISGVAGFSVSIIPIWLRWVLVAAAVVYVLFLISPLLKAKGILRK